MLPHLDAEEEGQDVAPADHSRGADGEHNAPGR